ncbi:hypothetical protein F2Q70_00040526 [Brassica cretica]|uniref:Uncharacterized protein n=1 Tax=Brassica cretica TaxID=69181 RepID=A0A8S9K4X4_BRACR|nr:hypothetical protein F2Q70_00040526 [Brassica cretica]
MTGPSLFLYGGVRVPVRVDGFSSALTKVCRECGTIACGLALEAFQMLPCGWIYLGTGVWLFYLRFGGGFGVVYVPMEVFFLSCRSLFGVVACGG